MGRKQVVKAEKVVVNWPAKSFLPRLVQAQEEIPVDGQKVQHDRKSREHIRGYRHQQAILEHYSHLKK